MICEKCGKNNRKGTEVCPYCGEKMPGNVNCGGFADILSYENKDIPTGAAVNNSAANDFETKKLMRKIDAVSEQSSRAVLFSLGALLLSIVFLVISITSCSMTSGKIENIGDIDGNVKKLDKRISELENKSTVITPADSEVPGEDSESDGSEDKTEDSEEQEPTDDTTDEEQKTEDDTETVSGHINGRGKNNNIKTGGN